MCSSPPSSSLRNRLGFWNSKNKVGFTFWFFFFRLENFNYFEIVAGEMSGYRISIVIDGVIKTVSGFPGRIDVSSSWQFTCYFVIALATLYRFESILLCMFFLTLSSVFQLNRLQWPNIGPMRPTPPAEGFQTRLARLWVWPETRGTRSNSLAGWRNGRGVTQRSLDASWECGDEQTCKRVNCYLANELSDVLGTLNLILDRLKTFEKEREITLLVSNRCTYPFNSDRVSLRLQQPQVGAEQDN